MVILVHGVTSSDMAPADVISSHSILSAEFLISTYQVPLLLKVPGVRDVSKQWVGSWRIPSQ